LTLPPTAPPPILTLSLHDALPIYHGGVGPEGVEAPEGALGAGRAARDPLVAQSEGQLGDHRRRADVEALARKTGSERRMEREGRDRKSTRLNSSHSQISYAVFCLK